MMAKPSRVTGYLLLVSCALTQGLYGCAENAESPPERPPRIGMAPITRVGVVVRDVEASARAFSEILGVPVTPARTGTIQLPDNSTAEIRSATFALPNVDVQLDQPVSSRGPLYEHLETFGPGMQYLEIPVTDGVDAMRARLQEKGGTWTAGALGGDYAFVDFRHTLGATIKVVNPPLPEAASNISSAPARPTALGTVPLAHVSFAVRDYDEAVTALADILDIAPVRAGRVDIVYPRGHPWQPDAQVDVATLRLQNTGIEIVEPLTTPSPWAESVETQRGNAMHHFGFNVDRIDQVEESVRFLLGKGGRWTVGGPKNFYAYVDFADTLGLTLEIVARERMPAPEPSSR